MAISSGITVSLVAISSYYFYSTCETAFKKYNRPNDYDEKADALWALVLLWIACAVLSVLGFIGVGLRDPELRVADLHVAEPEPVPVAEPEPRSVNMWTKKGMSVVRVLL